MIIWIDVNDLIHYFYTGNRPSGIQRLSFDLACALIEAGDGRVRACRHGPGARGFVEIDWLKCRAKLEGVMHCGSNGASVTAASGDLSAPPGEISSARRLARRLPLDLRIPLATIYLAERNAVAGLKHSLLAQFQAGRAFGTLLANGWRHLSPMPAARSVGRHLVTWREEDTDDRYAGHGHEQPVHFLPGDVLLSTGSTWQYPDYATRISDARAQGVRFAPFAHDMVPVLFPEWSVRSTTDAFSWWVETVLTSADLLFTNSAATARDVASHARALGLTIPPAIRLPIGATFPRRADHAAPPLHPRPYVLLVSTIEPRKNHAGMLRLWREMITHEPPELVPDLVLAGRVGWLAHDVIAQAGNADWFGGKLRLIEGPTDAELATLYRDCLFTIYPSFYEGWGLPVTESLCFGKTVAASNRASIPEAGGEFCVYFDPNDLNDTYRVVTGLIRNPGRCATLEAAIAAHYRPPTWHDSAQALLHALDRPELEMPEPEMLELEMSKSDRPAPLAARAPFRAVGVAARSSRTG